MVALPFIIILAALAIWFIGSIVFGKFIGSTATKLYEEFQDEMVEENINTNKKEI